MKHDWKESLFANNNQVLARLLWKPEVTNLWLLGMVSKNYGKVLPLSEKWMLTSEHAGMKCFLLIHTYWWVGLCLIWVDSKNKLPSVLRLASFLKFKPYIRLRFIGRRWIWAWERATDTFGCHCHCKCAPQCGWCLSTHKGFPGLAFSFWDLGFHSGHCTATWWEMVATKWALQGLMVFLIDLPPVQVPEKKNLQELKRNWKGDPREGNRKI